MDPTVSSVPLLEATRSRYINYALSVITSRALPDVRDGLKPVQRRILYAMYHNLRLTPDSRYRKSAAVVGEVMAKYHPHGDLAIYDAMVRLAQDFSLLHPLVDGQGNFGSIDGDNAAAMRYTECKLRPIAMELLTELKQRTVPMRPTYDGQNFEPIVLPAQFPHLLVNGCEGIAVGMATRIPPHNLRELIDACVMLIDRPEADLDEICRKVRGPDFPTGGEITSSAAELRAVYAEGQGPVRLRGTWEREQKGRKHFAILTSVPYGVVKADLVEKIGALIRERKLPQLTDVRDESTDTVRVVCELRSPEDAEAAVAYLYKHTAFQTLFHVNLTCLVPTENPEVSAPERLDLREILRHWLNFRCDTVRRRLEFELGELRERIHILDGFAKIFDILDEVIRIIRASEGKRDAAERLMDRFGLDDEQVEAILELRLYRLARLEINLILEELGQKRAEAERLAGILASTAALWDTVRTELLELRKQHGQPRRTRFAADAPEPAYEEHAYIVQEDAFVIVTRDGWLKRQGSVTAVDKVRVREGDSVGWMFRASTLSTITLLSSLGKAYVLRVDGITPTTGYGEPVQKSFAFADGEQVVGVVSNDGRTLPKAAPPPAGAAEGAAEEAPPPHLVAVTRAGRIVRLPLSLHAEVSTRAGRRYVSLDDDGADRVIAAYVSGGDEDVCVASVEGSMLCFQVWEAPVLKGAGKGVTAIKLKEGDAVLAFELSTEADKGPVVLDGVGREFLVRGRKVDGSRAGRGHGALKKNQRFVLWRRPAEIQLPKATPEPELEA